MDRFFLYSNLRKLTSKHILLFASCHKIYLTDTEAQEMLEFIQNHFNEIVDDISIIYTYYTSPFSDKFYTLLSIAKSKYQL